MPSLLAYGWVSRKDYLLHVFDKQQSDWSYRIVLGKDQLLRLDAFELELPVAVVYQHVTLEK